MLVVLVGLVASMALIASPAYASGEITVPSVRVPVDVVNDPAITQEVTTSVSGSNPQIAVSGVGGGLVTSVEMLSQLGGSGLALCPATSGGWSCTHSFVPGNVIIINYGTHQNQLVPIGMFTVTVTMGGANGATFTGSNSLCEVTHYPSDWSFIEATDQFEPTGDPAEPQIGLFSLIARNNGPAASAVTITITGLDGGPVVPTISSPCTQSPSTLVCSSPFSLPPSCANCVFVVQFEDRSPNWPKLRLTAKAAPLYTIDRNPPGSTVVLGPYSGRPLEAWPSAGGSTGGSASSNTAPGSTPAPSALPASASSSPGATAEPTDEPTAEPTDEATDVLMGASQSTGLGSGPELRIAAGVVALVLLGAGVVARRVLYRSMWNLFPLLRRRRQRVTGHTGEATGVMAASHDEAVQPGPGS
jgi:hypothetical protein